MSPFCGVVLHPPTQGKLCLPQTVDGQTDGVLKPIWFKRPEAPNNLFQDGVENIIQIADDSDNETIIVGDDLDLESIDELSDSDDEPWSDDSDSDTEEDEEDWNIWNRPKLHFVE